MTKNISQLIRDWPEKPQEVAKKTIEKYGQPDEATPSLLIWNNNGPWKRTIVNNNGPWKRTIVYREEVPHSFPKPHTDILEQFIDYSVPPEKFDDLAQYDGSVIVERTKGEISARCDKEEMNFLALNLANDIVTEKLSVDEARKTYAETAGAAMQGEMRPYTQKLQFKVPEGDTGDPDKPAMMPAMKGMAEAVVEKVKKAP
jgi:hypothetical protein